MLVGQMPATGDGDSRHKLVAESELERARGRTGALSVFGAQGKAYSLGYDCMRTCTWIG